MKGHTFKITATILLIIFLAPISLAQEKTTIKEENKTKTIQTNTKTQSINKLLLAQTDSSTSNEKSHTRPPIIPKQGDTTEELIIPHSTETDDSNHLQSTYLPTVTRTIIALAGASALLMIIVGGIQILTAYGNDEAISKAKKTITYSVVGLLIALLSYAIVSIISYIKL